MPGKISFLIILGGIFQYGLNTIYFKLPVNITVPVADAPTTTSILNRSLLFSYTYILYSGIFTIMKALSFIGGIQRSRSRFTSICSILFEGETFNCLINDFPITPSG